MIIRITNFISICVFDDFFFPEIRGSGENRTCVQQLLAIQLKLVICSTWNKWSEHCPNFVCLLCLGGHVDEQLI